MQFTRTLYGGIFIILVFNLMACTMSGAALSGAQALYDQHSIRKKLDDGYTSLKAYNDIYTKYKNNADINVSVASFNDTMLLTGQVSNTRIRSDIAKIAKKVAGKRKIFNYIEIANPASLLTHASDSWITAKIKTQLIASNIEPRQIKVVTENGTVYLLGMASREDADKIATIARTTTGVQKVVKIISYIYISKV